MSLRNNFSWMMAGNLIYAACQWMALIAIARLGTPEMVGEFAFALAVTSPIIIFFNLNMRAFQATDIKGEYLFIDYLFARLTQTVLALLTIFIVVTVSGYASSIVLIVAGVSLYKAIESISDIYYGRMQKREKMSRIGRSIALRGMLYLASLYAALRIFDSVAPGVLLVALSWAILLLFHDVKGVENRLKEGSRTTVATVWQLSSRCLPLGVVTFLVSLNANIPTYVIKNYLDIEQLGVFSAIVYFAIAGQFVTGALAQAAAPRLALYYSRSELGNFKLLQIKLMAIGAGMALAGVLFVTFLGGQLLGLFYGSEYAAHVDVFFWIMISAGIGYAAIFLGTGLTVTRRFREMLFLNLFSVATTFILSMALVPRYGLTGAGWALAASALLKLVINLMINYMTIYSKPGNPVS